MSDVEKAIERVRILTNSQPLRIDGLTLDSIAAIEVVLDELDRLTKPIEVAEVAEAIRKYKTFDVGEPQTWIAENWQLQAADLLIRLARENERLQTVERATHDRALHFEREMREARALTVSADQKRMTAEARAMRYAEALREIEKRDRIGSFSFVVGNKYVGLADFIAATLSDAEPETGEKK